MRFKVSDFRVLWGEYVFMEIGSTRDTSLLRRKSKRGLKEVEEGRFAGGLCADDQNANLQLVVMFGGLAAEAYLNGVGSFRLLTLRGLLIVLTALLA